MYVCLCLCVCVWVTRCAMPLFLPSLDRSWLPWFLYPWQSLSLLEILVGVRVVVLRRPQLTMGAPVCVFWWFPMPYDYLIISHSDRERERLLNYSKKKEIMITTVIGHYCKWQYSCLINWKAKKNKILVFFLLTNNSVPYCTTLYLATHARLFPYFSSIWCCFFFLLFVIVHVRCMTHDVITLNQVGMQVGR